MLNKLESLAQRIKQSRQRISENAQAIRDADVSLTESEEGKLIFPVKKMPGSFSVCAVDGGLLADRLFGADILIRRSVAACFTYQDSKHKTGNSKLETVHHHPRKFPDPEVDFRTGLDEHEAMVFRSLFRLKGELDVALEALEKFKPDYLLLDGSIVLLGSDKPSDRSTLSEEYNSLLKTYKTLYQKCSVSGVQLVGVIKDSRGKRLVECLQDQMLVDVPDTTLADVLLKEGERSCVLPYSSDVKKHPVLNSLGSWAEKMDLFYFKPSADDSPLRIEYLRTGRSADEIASLISSLSRISKTFAYPAALIEADMCAALEPLEMDKIKRSLFVLSGGAAKPLRRQTRPFR